FGNIITTDNATTVNMAIGVNPAAGILSGTTAQTAVNGIATFGDLSINVPGTGYVLAASSTGLTGATSDTFNITGVLPGSAWLNSQLSNAEIVIFVFPDATQLGQYQFNTFIHIGGPTYLYHPLTPTDMSAFEEFILRDGDYSFLDGVLTLTGHEGLLPFLK
ncbi:MAG: hypothetical protein COX40_03285, partial [Candidatus Omnitrophica bacterium CG23_combo_of_CG06-09_8_20_14_all_40_11]